MQVELLILIIIKIVTSLQCPSRTEACLHLGNLYKVDTPGAPECWLQSLGGIWTCEYRIEKCLEYRIDIDTCYPNDPPSCPDEESTETCQNQMGELIKERNPGKDVCWYQDISGLRCQSKLGSSCGRHSLEITKCPHSATVTCPQDPYTPCTTLDGDRNLAGIPGINTCWQHGKNGQWTCQPPINGTCPILDVDINQCDMPKPACPPSNKTSCLNSIHTFTAGNPDKSICWNQNRNGAWICSQPKLKNCPGDTININHCDIPDEPIFPCPTSSCNSGKGGLLNITSANYFRCWSKNNNNEFNCFHPDEPQCPKDSLDVNQCPSLESPTCPKNLYQTSCLTSLGPRALLHVPTTESCAEKTVGGGWICQPRTEKGCNENQVDLETCPSPPPPCPPRDASCLYQGISFPRSNSSPSCWRLEEAHWEPHWTCMPKFDSNDCPASFVDIQTCFPKLPACPNDPLVTCHILSNRTTFTSNLFESVPHPVTDTPDNNLLVYAGQPDKHVCWHPYELQADHSWQCDLPTDNGQCHSGWLDLRSDCEIASVPRPSCPSQYTDYCFHRGHLLLAGESKNSPCWRPSAVPHQWSCSNESPCPPTTVDLSQCPFTMPLPPPCPHSSTMCHHPKGNFSMTKEIKYPCWRPNSGHWSCRSYSDDKTCRFDHIDITKC